MEPLEGFDKFGPGMFLHRPATSATREDESCPSLIVFCTFMGASLKIVGKYTAGYQKLFPASTILVILSNVSDTFSTDRAQARRTELASATIVDLKASLTPGSVLLHVMSNGGAIASARIAQHLHDTGHPNTIFSHTIMDCTPSYPQLQNGAEAMTMQVPTKSRFLKWLVYWALYIYMGTMMLLFCGILRREDMVTRLRRRWTDTQLFDPQAPRLYMFSMNDALIPYKDVQEHAQDARVKGWKDVRDELFETAPHCALIMEDAGRYWDAIKQLATGRKE